MLITTIFYFLHIALHKKWSFPLRISSVTFTEEIHIGKLYFLCSVAYNLRRRYFNQRSYFIQNKFKTLPVYSHAFIEFIVRPIQLCIWPKYFLFSSISIRSFFDLVFLAFLHWLFPWRPDILQHGPNKGKNSCHVQYLLLAPFWVSFFHSSKNYFVFHVTIMNDCNFLTNYQNVLWAVN